MNEKFRIGVYDEIEEVYINFFINQEIIEENKIGDTYFIRIKNGKENLTYSIHQNYYDKVQSSKNKLLSIVFNRLSVLVKFTQGFPFSVNTVPPLTI